MNTDQCEATSMSVMQQWKRENLKFRRKIFACFTKDDEPPPPPMAIIDTDTVTTFGSTVIDSVVMKQWKRDNLIYRRKIYALFDNDDNDRRVKIKYKTKKPMCNFRNETTKDKKTDPTLAKAEVTEELKKTSSCDRNGLSTSSKWPEEIEEASLVSLKGICILFFISLKIKFDFFILIVPILNHLLVVQFTSILFVLYNILDFSLNSYLVFYCIHRTIDPRFFL